MDTTILALAALLLPVKHEETLPDARTATLIRQMGDESFRVREAAHVELERLGWASRHALEAARHDSDPEIRSRVDRLLADLYAISSPADDGTLPLISRLAGRDGDGLYAPWRLIRGVLVHWYMGRSLHATGQTWYSWTPEIERFATFLLLNDLRRMGATKQSIRDIQLDMAKRSDPIPKIPETWVRLIKLKWGVQP